jgi:hypothetical protein
MGIPVGEDATVRRHQPVAMTIWRRGHADDWLIEGGPSRRPVELGVTKRKYPPAGGDQPIALTVRRRRGGRDRRAELALR